MVVKLKRQEKNLKIIFFCILLVVLFHCNSYKSKKKSNALKIQNLLNHFNSLQTDFTKLHNKPCNALQMNTETLISAVSER